MQQKCYHEESSNGGYVEQSEAHEIPQIEGWFGTDLSVTVAPSGTGSSSDYRPSLIYNFADFRLSLVAVLWIFVLPC